MAGRTGGRGGRGRGAPGARGMVRGGKKPQAKPTTINSTKFKGNCAELQGCIFDCSDYKQADTFVSTLKRVSEHIGSTYNTVEIFALQL